MADLLRNRRQVSYANTNFASVRRSEQGPDLSALSSIASTIFTHKMKMKEIRETAELESRQLDMQGALESKRIDNSLKSAQAQDQAGLAAAQARTDANERTDMKQIAAKEQEALAEVRAREQAAIDASRIAMAPDGERFVIPETGGGLIYQKVFKEVLGQRYIYDFQGRQGKKLGEIQSQEGSAAERFAKMEQAARGALEAVPDLFRADAERFLMQELDQRSTFMLNQEREWARSNAIEFSRLQTESLAVQLQTDIALGQPTLETEEKLRTALAARFGLQDISAEMANMLFQDITASAPAFATLRRITQDATSETTVIDPTELNAFNFAIANGNGDATLTMSNGTVLKAGDVISALKDPQARNAYGNKLQEMAVMLSQRDKALKDQRELSADLEDARNNPIHILSSKSQSELDKLAQGVDLRNSEAQAQALKLATEARYVPKPVLNQIEQMLVTPAMMADGAQMVHILTNLKGANGADIGSTLNIPDGIRDLAAMVTTGIEQGMTSDEIRLAMKQASGTSSQDTVATYNKTRPSGSPRFEQAVTDKLAEAEGIDPASINPSLLTTARRVFHLMANVTSNTDQALAKTVEHMQERLVFSEAFRGGWAMNSGNGMLNPEDPNASIWSFLSTATRASNPQGMGFAVESGSRSNKFSMAEDFIFAEVEPLLDKMDEEDRDAIEALMAERGSGQLLGKKMWLQPTNTDKGVQQFELWVSTGDDSKYQQGQQVFITDEKGLRPLILDTTAKLNAEADRMRKASQSKAADEGLERQISTVFREAGYYPFSGTGGMGGAQTREQFLSSLPPAKRAAIEHQIEGLRRKAGR